MAYGSILLLSIHLSCSTDHSSIELIAPCKEMLPEKRADPDTLKQQKARQAQTAKGRLAAAERQMDTAITTQNPIKSPCPQTGHVSTLGKGFGTSFPYCSGTPGLSLLTLLPRERVLSKAEHAEAPTQAWAEAWGWQSPSLLGTKTTPRMQEPRRDRPPHHLLISVADAALGIPRATFVTCLGVFSANLAGQ